MKFLLFSALVILFLVATCHARVKANKYTCCMPHAHTTHFKSSVLMLGNCENGKCVLLGNQVSTNKHMPDFYNRRYRMDNRVEVNGQLVNDRTTMGFLEAEPSNFGVEYNFNTTHCTCKTLSKPDEHPDLMLSCVEPDFTLDSTVRIGSVNLAHINAQKFVRGMNSNGTVLQQSMLIQPLDNQQKPLPSKNDPYPANFDCLIIQGESVQQDFNSNGQLVGMQKGSIFFYDFLPYNTDADFIVPSYCPKCS